LPNLLDPTQFGIVGFLFCILGLLFGSFANLLIYRIPLEKPWAWDRSRCSKCQKTIPWYDNIPVLSWFLLRGKCRKCGAPYSFRYVVVELLTGILFGIAYWYYGFSWSLIEALIFSWSLVVCSFIDFDHMILPDEFTLSGIVIGLLGAALNPERSFIDSLLGVLIGGGFLWFMAFVYFQLTKKDGLGGGDIKLLAWIGAILGWKAIPFVITASAIVGSIIGILFALRSREGFKTAIPFGPYLALAALIYLFGGQTLAQAYFDLFMPGLS
jgi:leader peptidase (prepilin peptidase) / N-methyltransferase